MLWVIPSTTSQTTSPEMSERTQCPAAHTAGAAQLGQYSPSMHQALTAVSSTT